VNEHRRMDMARIVVSKPAGECQILTYEPAK